MVHLTTRKLAGMVRSHNLSTILIWTTGIIAMTVWTVIDVQPLLETYLYHNVDNRIAVVRNDSGWPPNLTVCLPYYSDSLSKIGDWLLNGSPANSCMECETLAQRGWDVWRDFNLTLQEPAWVMKDMLFDSFLRRILDERKQSNGLDFLTLNRSNFNWNQPLIDAVSIFLGQMTLVDIYFLMGHASAYLEAGSVETYNDVIRAEIVDDLRDRVLSAVQMYYRRTVLHDLDIIFRGIRGDKSGAIFPPLERPVFTQEGICFQVQNASVQEFYEFIPIENDSIDPPWIRTPRTTGFSIWLDERVMYGIGDIQLSNAIYTSELASTFELICLDFNVDVRVVETRSYVNCIRNETPFLCGVRKSLAEVITKCGCMPLGQKQIFPNLGRELPYCSPDVYERCAPNMETTFFSYQDTCSNQCEFVSHKPKSTATVRRDDSKSLQFWVIYPYVFFSPFVQVSIIEKLSSEEFISQLGGTIGVFLGFSGLTVIALLVFCIERVRARIYLRKGRETNNVLAGQVSSIGNQLRISPSGDEGGEGVANKSAELTEKERTQEEKMIERMMERMREERKATEKAIINIEKKIDRIEQTIKEGTRRTV